MCGFWGTERLSNCQRPTVSMWQQQGSDWSVIFHSLCSYLLPNASVEGPQRSGWGQWVLCFRVWSAEHLPPREPGSWLELDSWGHPHSASKVWEWVREPVLLTSTRGFLGSLNILGVTGHFSAMWLRVPDRSKTKDFEGQTERAKSMPSMCSCL